MFAVSTTKRSGSFDGIRRWRAWRSGALAATVATASLALPAAASAQLSFRPPTNFAVGTNPYSVAVGDFNGDSDADLAVANEGADNVSVLLGGTGASFGAATNLPVGFLPRSVVVADFNGDSDPDLAVANHASSDISVLLGGAGGSFGAATNFPAGDGPGEGPISLAVGDFNGDADPDLAVAKQVTGNVSVLLGGAGASFGAATSFPTTGVQGDPLSVAVGEFNGDSDPDLAVANRFSNNVSVLLGGAGGSFGAATNFPVGNQPASVAVGEFNGDSDPDLAVANLVSNDVSVLLGGPGGSFGAATNFPGGGNMQSVVVGDFNGDFDPDLAVAIGALRDTVSVLPGGAGGSFGPPASFAAGDAPLSIAAGDFDRDADLDLVSTNYLGGDVSVLRNNRPPSAAAGAYATDEETSLAVAAPGVLGNDSDPDGDTLSAAQVSGPGHGTLLLNPDGSLSYAPDRDFSGTDTFSYRARDGILDSGAATVTIEVRAVNDTPTAFSDAYTTAEDTPLTVDSPGVLDNDTDPDGDALTAARISGPYNGNLALNADGSLSYTPNPGFHGTDTFTYRASDGTVDSGAVTVAIDVTPVADAPPQRPTPAPQPRSAPAPAATTAPAAGAAPPPSTRAPAIGRLRLDPGCVRRARSGRTRVRITLGMPQPLPVEVQIERAVGKRARRSCPKRGGRFPRRFRKLTTLRRLDTQPAGASRRRLTLKLRLAPGVYRLSVRARLGQNRLSPPVSSGPLYVLR